MVPRLSYRLHGGENASGERREQVVEMTRIAALPVLGSEFDDFLFAPICEQGNGMLLSVVSALARLDVDPWQEAAQLSLLPGETATQRLASLIVTLPDGLSAHLDPKTVAAGLIALLPRQIGPNGATREAVRGVPEATNSRASTFVMFYVIFMTCMLGAQIIIASREVSAPIDSAHAPTSGTDTRQMPSH
jgi:hypothetical protein